MPKSLGAPAGRPVTNGARISSRSSSPIRRAAPCLISLFRSSYTSTPRVAASPRAPTASSVTGASPAFSSPTAATDSVGTSARSLKRMSVRSRKIATARSYSSRSRSSSAITILLGWILSDFEQNRVALAAAGADRGEAEAAAVAVQLVDHRREDPGARGADRVPEGHRAAVDVDLLGIGAEHLGRVEHD